MTWVGWAVVVHVACAVGVVAVWWREVGRHDAAERRNRRLHDGHRGPRGYFDLDPDDDERARFLDRHRHDREAS